MKTLPILAAVITCTTLSSLAQNAAPKKEIPIPKQAHALLIYDEKKFEEVWIDKATPTRFQYRVTANAIDRKIKTYAACTSIYLYEPAAYRYARDLYQARRFDDARKEFARIRDALKAIRDLPNNHGTLSGFYELECLRQLGDLEGLKKALDAFHPKALTRKDHLRQIDLYKLWDAVNTKSWQRLDLMCQDRRKKPMPGYQRVQVAYCHGLALEGLEKPVKALNAYATTIVSDYGASQELVRKAALNSLRIYSNDEQVQLAMRLVGTEDENKNSTGHFRMLEAGALAKTYKTILGAGKGLPTEYKKFLKYAPKGQSTAIEAPKPKKDAKKKDAKK
jgi:hypothetical protein